MIKKKKRSNPTKGRKEDKGKKEQNTRRGGGEDQIKTRDFGRRGRHDKADTCGPRKKNT